MMGVFISDMDIPGGCKECDFCETVPLEELAFYCNRNKRYLSSEEACNIPVDCPISEPDKLKIFGYEMPRLILFAYACQQNGVTEKDLKEFATNCELAFQLVIEAQNDAFKRCIDSLGKTLKEAKEDK